MKLGQTNHLNMMEAVQQAFIDNTAFWTPNIAIGNAVADFTSCINSINTLSMVQQTSTTGVTQTKTDAKEAMADMAADIASAGRGYAHDTNNTNLFNLMSITKSDIIGTPDNDADDKAMGIYSALNPLIANLGNYGPTVQLMGILLGKINVFSSFLGVPQDTATTTVIATASLTQLFANADIILKNRLDNLMVQFKTSNPEFYNRYNQNRAIKNIGHRKTVIITGFIYDNHTPAQILPHVLITLTGTDATGNAVNLSKHTDVNGHFRFNSLHIGSYTVTPSLSGYTCAPKTSSITEAQTIIDDFVMTAAATAG